MSKQDLLDKIANLPAGPSEVPEVPPPELVGFFVVLVRGLRQWKQSTLAEFAGVSLTTVERVERGEKVRDESLDRIAEALGYESGYFTSPRTRSEEHTSELQSLMRISYAVFCLKKKKKNT